MWHMPEGVAEPSINLHAPVTAFMFICSCIPNVLPRKGEGSSKPCAVIEHCNSNCQPNIANDSEARESALRKAIEDDDHLWYVRPNLEDPMTINEKRSNPDQNWTGNIPNDSFRMTSIVCCDLDHLPCQMLLNNTSYFAFETITTSLYHFKTSVSVECPRRKLDLVEGSESLLDRYFSSCR